MKTRTPNIPMSYLILALSCAFSLVSVTGCVSVRTIPAIARAEDTVSLMLAGSEETRKETVSVTLTDAADNSYVLTYPPTPGNGGIRSVFNVRADGTAAGLHYSDFLTTLLSWSYGHEALQSVLVLDLPAGLATGMATLEVNPNVADNSAGVVYPATIDLEIIPGQGAPDNFDRFDALAPGGTSPAALADLEPAPYEKISFSGSQAIGAASLVIDFDETVVPPLDLNLYVPQSTVTGGIYNLTFADHQRMVYWHQDGQKLYVDIVCPQGINPLYLKLYVVHRPPALATSPFILESATLYDTAGNVIDGPVPTATTAGYMP